MDLDKGKVTAMSNVPRRPVGPDLAAQQRLAGSCEALSHAIPADAFGAPTKLPVLTILEQASIKGARL